MMRLVFVAVDFLREPCLLVGPCSPRCEPVPYRVSANKAPEEDGKASTTLARMDVS